MSSLISGGSTGTWPTCPLSATVIAIASANVIALMMIIRLVKKAITPAATVTKPILVPVVVPIPVSVVVVPVVLKELPSAVVTIIIPLVSVVVVVVHATTATSTVHLVALIVLEGISVPLLILLVVPVVKVRLDLLRPAAIHFRLAIVLHLTLTILPSLQSQLPVHVSLLPIPAAHRCSIAAVRKVLQLLNHVPTAIPVIPVEGIALELLLLMLLLLLRLVRILTTSVRLIPGSQWSSVRGPSIRNGRRVTIVVLIVCRGGISGRGRRGVLARVGTAATATAAAATRAVVTDLPEPRLGLDDRWGFGRAGGVVIVGGVGLVAGGWV